MNEASRKSRRVLAVISPACFNENWDAGTVYKGLKQLKALGPPLLCVALKQLPTDTTQLKNDQGETLVTLLRTITVIQWNRLVTKWISYIF